MIPVKEFERFLTLGKKVPANRIPYYVMWVDRFLAFTGREPEEERFDTEEINRFLAGLGKTYEEWQVKQAQDSLRLYRYFLTRTKQQKANQGATLPDNEEWQKVQEEMVKALRLRHRALSTEKSYLYWVKNFFHYVHGQAPATLTGNQVRDFLSYLAVERRIAASTHSVPILTTR